MISLQPQKNFTIVRQVADSTDATVYYVQAVVRNAYTDAIITTLNLEDKGSQRFKKDWQVPADPSGEGFYISIITDVYSDSGYTTKNPLFETEEDTYLVYDRIVKGQGGGGGLDAFTVRKIVREEIEKIEKAEIPEVVDLSPVLKAIKDIKIPTQEKVDLSPVLKAIKDKPVTVVDLSPILEKLNEPEEKVEAVDLSPVIEKIDATKVDLSPILKKIESIDAHTILERNETKLMFKELEYRLNQKLEDIPKKEKEIDLTEIKKLTL